MKPTKTNHQVGLWDFCRNSIESGIDEGNELGPYKSENDCVISRHLDCINYDQCLGYAAKKNWHTFVCYGCRKVKGMNLVDE